MRPSLVVIATLLLSGCTSQDHSGPGAAYLTVVAGETAPHVIDWAVAQDGSEGARLVEAALVAAETSRLNASVRAINETEQEAIEQWVERMGAYHSAPGALPIRYRGQLYWVGVDQTSG